MAGSLWNAERARASAQVIVAAVRSSTGLKLDYSEPSIVMLEDAISGEWGLDPDGISDQVLDGIGCYVGELMARHLGAEWASETAEPTVRFDGGQVPVASRTREALAGGGDRPVTHMYALVRAGVTQGMLRPVGKRRGGFLRR